MRYGLCGPGRHVMPVTRYLVPNDILFFSAYDQAKVAVAGLHGKDRILDLYLTGMTRPLLGVLAGIEAYGIPGVRIWEYHNAEDRYVCTTRMFRGPDGRYVWLDTDNANRFGLGAMFAADEAIVNGWKVEKGKAVVVPYTQECALAPIEIRGVVKEVAVTNGLQMVKIVGVTGQTWKVLGRRAMTEVEWAEEAGSLSDNNFFEDVEKGPREWDV